MTTDQSGGSFFESVVSANGADVMRYLEGRVHDGGDAAEAYGETLLTAWRARRRMPTDPAEARLWLFGVARKVLLNNTRSLARRSAATQRLRERITAAPPPPASTDAVEVRDAIKALPTELADVIRLTYWDGFTSHEIADFLGIPASTVRTRISTARELLRTALDPAATARDQSTAQSLSSEP
ncbi:RNA polymerase sigma factor [Microbacterium sp. ABRD28]|uniref:RNA polymerase sigma factor n=1 Tax=Microbacterium sp. ABRD28 TaxID=2268461 RepID=UPI000F550824|nr:RNA polymerase sigma factor [Microbacterium sp. ABRD28]AZC13554.1 RNA polymerase sigma factor [Microbacterium sp. ABRD28]